MPDAIDHNANTEMVVNMLTFNGVEQGTNTALSEVTDEGVKVVERDLEVLSNRCDSMVLAVGLKPEGSLGEFLHQKKHRFHKVGNCLDPRIILNAVWGVYKIANSI